MCKFKLSSCQIKLIGMLLVLFFTLPARAETTNCTPITTLPTTITTQGIYCLTGNLTISATTGIAITINSNNVTIDLNGYKIGGLGAGTGTSMIGIYALQRKNITVRNGILRGFLRGIYLNDSEPYTTSQGHLLEDLLLDKNTWIGIIAQGRGITLRRNRIVDTGGTTVTSGSAYGLSLVGPGHRVMENDITTVVATIGSNENAVGMHLFRGDNSVVENNNFSDMQADGTGNAYGFATDLSNSVTVRGNNVTSAEYGIYYGSSSTGIYRDNITDNITTTNYTNGTDGGGNI